MTAHPDARRLTTGEIVDFDTGEALPNYTGPVYAEPLPGVPYILWSWPADDNGRRRFEVINQGSVVVQSELDKFIKEASEQ